MRTKNARRNRASTESKGASFRCRTCQVRRVKCDGAQPACNSCTSTGRVCPGYSSWELSIDFCDALFSAPHVQQPEISQTQCRPPLYDEPALPIWNLHVIDDQARHAFDYFRHRIFDRIVERGYPTLWATISCAVGLQEPAVFYAMAAYSFVEQGLAQTIHTSLSRPVNREFKASALQMYSKAIACLRGPLRQAIKENGPLEPIILCCIIFIAIEVTSGNTLSAIRHARVGKKILEERLSNSGSSENANPEPSSMASELQMIGNMWTEMSSIVSIVKPQNSGLKVPFGSVEEARSSLEILIDAGHDIREQLILQAQDSRGETVNASDTSNSAAKFCLAHTFSRTMDITVSLQRRIAKTIDGFVSWGSLFRISFSSEDLQSEHLLLLQLRSFYSHFTLSMCRASSERQADSFADRFVLTLDDAEQILGNQPLSGEGSLRGIRYGPVCAPFMRNLIIAETGRPPETNEKCSMKVHSGPLNAPREPEDVAAGVFEFGILHALFTVACRCRTSHLRRKALELLHDSKRIESVNSSRALSMYAEAIIHLEEQQARRLAGLLLTGSALQADEVPEEARFIDVVAQPAPQGHSQFTLSCTRHVRPDGEEIELLEYECDVEKGEYRLAQSTRGPFAQDRRNSVPLAIRKC